VPLTPGQPFKKPTPERTHPTGGRHREATIAEPTVQTAMVFLLGRRKTKMENDNHQNDNEQPQPVVFTPEQQAKVDLIVKAAMGRAASETRRELDIERQERARLDGELKTAQEALSATGTERDALKHKHADAEQRATTLRRDAFISKKCLDYNFVDSEIVTSLTEQSLEWDDAKQSFVVVGSDATTDEFFAAFAAKKPYLVKSDVRNGSGSEPSTRTSLPSGQQRYKVEEIFGRGSNSQLANQLAQKDPAEYRRLKSQARNKQLI
jgi:hypothetical protein